MRNKNKYIIYKNIYIIIIYFLSSDVTEHHMGLCGKGVTRKRKGEREN